MFEHAEPLSNLTLRFTAYGPPSPEQYGIFFITLFLYISTILSNFVILLLIYFDSSLHKPMYIFVFNLAINGVLGSTAVCPKMMAHLLNDSHFVSIVDCLIQSLSINIYASCAYAIFAAMAYDRYVCICKPLQYHSIMTPLRVKVILASVYVLPVSLLCVQSYLTSRLPLCGHYINKLFCDNLAIVNLSCIKDVIGNLYGICLVFVLVVLPLFLVILSYVKILQVSLNTSVNAQKKALQTCAPHLIAFLNFSVAILFSVIYNRISYYLPQEINILISLDFILLPPLLHPLIYGFKTKDIRKSMYKFFKGKMLISSEIVSANQNVSRDKILFC